MSLSVESQGSGKSLIIEWLEKIGVKTLDDGVSTVLLKVKERSIGKKGLLTEKEFEETVEQSKR